MQQIYLDYNATTPIADEVQQAMLPFLFEHYGNPSSSHALGRTCKEAIEEARGRVATLIGADPSEIFFTGGGTESNNIAIKGTFLQPECKNGGLVTSCFEHPAIEFPARHHEELGGFVTRVNVDTRGVVDVSHLENELTDQVVLVSVMHSNNEIGTLQPIREIGALCERQGKIFHTDASQSLGKVRVKVEELGVDMLTIAGHKLYAPKGVGALYVKQGTNLVPPTHGANHERGIRPGTENVPYIVALGVAAQLANQKLTQENNRLNGLRNRLESLLKSEIPGLVIHGDKAERLPNTSSIGFPSTRADRMLKRIPELCVSTGAACHSDSVTLSSTLKAIQVPESIAAGTIRVSCGKHTTEAEIEKSANLLISAWEATHEPSNG